MNRFTCNYFAPPAKRAYLYLDDPDDEVAQAATAEAEEREARRNERASLGEMRAAVGQTGLSGNLKRQLRAYLADDDAEKHELVRRYLQGEIRSESELEREMQTLAEHERSWGAIFNIQREIRKKIHRLQWRVEGYYDRLPQRRKAFDEGLKDVRRLNREDSIVERGLVQELGKLTQPDGGASVFTAKEVREIYTTSPNAAGFESTMKKYQDRIQGRRNGEALFRTILALKRREAEIERNFEKAERKAHAVIRENLNMVRRKANTEQVLDMASSAVGVTIKEGVTLVYNRADPEDLIPIPKKTTVKITKVEVEEIPIFDASGNTIDYRLGVPVITLQNGHALRPYTLGRFKKWVDAVDATEEINSAAEINKATGLSDYGMSIKPGMSLMYMQRSRDKDGKIASRPQYVTVTEIGQDSIFFNTEIQYAPGFEDADTFELRSNLRFGEFVKWWHRYDVSETLSQETLRERLEKWNSMENHHYGIGDDENPPITLEKGERLWYPDDSKMILVITDITSDGVKLNDGSFYNFPEFFYWVKNNHVERVPPDYQSPQELKLEVEREKETQEKKMEDMLRLDIKKEIAHDRFEDIYKHKREVEAVTPLKRIREIWWQTHLLSLRDIWNMVVEVRDFVKRRHERRTKARYSSVGAGLPGVLGTEFNRVAEEAEHGEVNKYKEAMESWGIPQLQRTLYDTNDKDVAKSCIIVLVSKGEMRWDQPALWRALNRLTARYTTKGTKLYIPDPEHMPPGESGEDLVRPAIDALWGEGGAAEWYMDNISKYNSHKNNFEYKFKQLENDPKGIGGPKGELERMLKSFRDGEYVNPQEYEAILDGAIKFGKMGAEAKMFYLLAGVTTRHGENKGHHDGETLLHIDRLGELNSKYLNNFPLLDFFTQEMIYDPFLKRDRKFNLSDYMEMKEKYFPDDFKKGAPGNQFSRFVWEVMLLSNSVRTRISKGLRNAENIDHDDAHLYIPPGDMQEVEQLTTSTTGSKKFFTTEGYANAYPGFNQYINSIANALSEEHNDEKRAQRISALHGAINSFIRYDLIMDNRYNKGKGEYARLDAHHFERSAVTDSSVKLKVHQAQLRNLVMELAEAYGYGEEFAFLYTEKTGSILDPKEAARQKDYERRVQELPELITQMISEDKGKKALEVIQRLQANNPDSSEGLRGIKGSKRPSPDELRDLRKRAREALIQRQSRGGGG